MLGLCRVVTVDIYVNRNHIINDTSCSAHSEWDPCQNGPKEGGSTGSWE